MKKGLTILLIIIVFTFLSGMMVSCKSDKQAANENSKLTFATSATYPPFEFYENGELKGFDIDLAKLIASELGKTIEFQDMQFSSILPAVEMGQVDAAIATFTITEERKKSFDFSEPYHFESMAAVFKEGISVKGKEDLAKKKIACQFGSTMEIWLKKNFPNASLVVMDEGTQAIEALKAGHADVALIDGVQGPIFCKKNPGLSYTIIAKSDDGYGVAGKKGSPLIKEINQALKILKEKGKIVELEKKWLGEHQ